MAMGKASCPLARSCITREVVLSFAGKQMPVIFLLKRFSNFTVEMIWRVLVAPALLSQQRLVFGKRKVDGGRKKLLLGGLFLSEG